MLEQKNSNEVILMLDARDFTSSYNSELLAHLEDCPSINFGSYLMFSPAIVFENNNGATPKVLQAFNFYLRYLRMTCTRIVINNI